MVLFGICMSMCSGSELAYFCLINAFMMLCIERPRMAVALASNTAKETKIYIIFTLCTKHVISLSLCRVMKGASVLSR